MRDGAELALAAVRRLPPAALVGLREAFAAEVADRLPRLRAAAASPDAGAPAEVLRDAHSLGSSAAVVGEAEVSRAARAAEAALLVDPPDLPAFRTQVDELVDRLTGWTP